MLFEQYCEINDVLRMNVIGNVKQEGEVKAGEKMSVLITYRNFLDFVA